MENRCDFLGGNSRKILNLLLMVTLGAVLMVVGSVTVSAASNIMADEAGDLPTDPGDYTVTLTNDFIFGDQQHRYLGKRAYFYRMTKRAAHMFRHSFC